ncbi:OLC1v1029373C2 [Oldenlandia corymbosa var. corymbosa]|nr:OLC1v1029373C2 [Oldenlandia corymbosa var. corymbosa]
MPQYCVECKKIGHDIHSCRHNTTISLSQKVDSWHLKQQPKQQSKTLDKPRRSATQSVEKNNQHTLDVMPPLLQTVAAATADAAPINAEGKSSHQQQSTMVIAAVASPIAAPTEANNRGIISTQELGHHSENMDSRLELPVTTERQATPTRQPSQRSPAPIAMIVTSAPIADIEKSPLEETTQSSSSEGNKQSDSGKTPSPAKEIQRDQCSVTSASSAQSTCAARQTLNAQSSPLPDVAAATLNHHAAATTSSPEEEIRCESPVKIPPNSRPQRNPVPSATPTQSSHSAQSAQSTQQNLLNFNEDKVRNPLSPSDQDISISKEEELKSNSAKSPPSEKEGTSSKDSSNNSITKTLNPAAAEFSSPYPVHPGVTSWITSTMILDNHYKRSDIARYWLDNQYKSPG